MIKLKLKLEPFEIGKKNMLSAKFLSKIQGGYDNLPTSDSPSESNLPGQTVSVQTNTEVEINKER